MEQLTRFDEFMRSALYDEEKGYYVQGAKRVGKEGDFFTSVSVGDLFGHFLCHRLFTLWNDLGTPERFLVIEMGANDGRLAADILNDAAGISPDFSLALQYIIIEPLAAMRSIQEKTTGGKALIVSSVEDVPAGKGAFIANELLDAFPVRMAVVEKGEWREKYVSRSHDYEWITQPLPQGEGPPADPSRLPDGYTTEWTDAYDSFFQRISPLLEEGLFLFFDYGRSEQDYYSPTRSEGTLRTYYRHTRTDNPLIHVGEQDITTDVNFTAAARAAQENGLVPALWTEQAHWLTSIARPWLLDLEKNPPPPEEFRKKIAQFQTLTHPQHMGMQFKVLELFKGKILLPDLLSSRTGISDLGL